MPRQQIHVMRGDEQDAEADDPDVERDLAHLRSG